MTILEEENYSNAKARILAVDLFDVGSPKGAIRSCREVGVLPQEQAIIALEMADDRNLTVQTYNEKLAIEIFGRLRTYRDILMCWLEGLR
ncbi:nucleotidyltransferase substrate binding protein [Paenibacillus sp.]|uniref:nucleotidyltransferase substrate binding protein n=1 Tax=Paenibacillus sp. TaxID=58172 RepID=UPI0039C921EC